MCAGDNQRQATLRHGGLALPPAVSYSRPIFTSSTQFDLEMSSSEFHLAQNTQCRDSTRILCKTNVYSDGLRSGGITRRFNSNIASPQDHARVLRPFDPQIGFDWLGRPDFTVLLSPSPLCPTNAVLQLSSNHPNASLAIAGATVMLTNSPQIERIEIRNVDAGLFSLAI